MVGWLVGFVRFDVSILRLFPSGVVIHTDSAGRLLIQVRKYFSGPALIILLAICSIVLLTSTIFLQFFNFIDSNLFNCFARVWYNCFARNYNLIWLIFFERDITIFLNILISPILFLLWGYTITIDGNVHNVIEMCSTMLRICCTTLGFFMTTINMFLNVSVYDMYSFYLRFLHIQQIFHLIDGRFLCCARKFEGQSAE